MRGVHTPELPIVSRQVGVVAAGGGDLHEAGGHFHKFAGDVAIV